MANMIKLDYVDKCLIENCTAVAYSGSLILLNINTEYELNIVNPQILEGTPYLIKQSVAITTALGRLAGTVTENRRQGYIAALPAGTTAGDVVVLSTGGRFVATAAVPEQNNCSVVMYPSSADDAPGVIAMTGITAINADSAVNAGDILTSGTVAHKAHSNNNQNDGRKIIATAMETIASAGAVWGELSTAAGGSPTVAEALQNKTITSYANTFSGVAQDPSRKRWGSFTPVSSAATTAAAVSSLQGCLTAHVPTGAGTNTSTYDTTEGLVSNFVATATGSLNIGLVSPASTVGICRTLFGGYMRARCKIDSTTSARFWVGFIGVNAIPAASDTVMTTGTPGVIVGWSSADTNWSIYQNDASGAVTVTPITGPIAKNGNYNTIEIYWPAGGATVNVAFNGTVQTLSSNIPPTTSDLWFNAVGQTTTTTARTFSIHSIWAEFDK
jgi:hypothetical protein